MGKLGGGKELANMVAVGAVGPHDVRLWFRTEVAGKHRVELRRIGTPDWAQTVSVHVNKRNQGDNTHALHYPNDFPGTAPLQSLARYKYKVTRIADDAPLGQGRFETAPASEQETPDEFSFGMMSCHQPFNSDGELSSRKGRMLALASKAFAAHNTKFVLACGDQVYADSPGEFSLADPHYFEGQVLPIPGGLTQASTAQVRQAYQQRYRQFWSMRSIQKIYQDNPCYPVLDDHEILDDWGSLRAHQSPAYQSIGEGARQAYYDYQGARVATHQRLPASLHYEFTYGRLAGFAMDLRSERKTRSTRNQIYSSSQFSALRNFLKSSASKHVIVIMASVPVVHIPSWMADAGHSIAGSEIDFLDQWSYSKNRNARDKLLQLLHKHHDRHPHQRVILVGGDVHIAAAFAIHWRGGNKPTMYQFTSSAISNRLSGVGYWLSKLGPESVAALGTGKGGPRAKVHLLDGSVNPFGGLNIGVVKVRHHGEHSTVRFQVLGYKSSRSKTHTTMFDSGEL